MKTTKRDRALVLNLTDAEMSALDELAELKGQTKSGVLRQALRLYISVDARARQGARFVFETPDKSKTEVLLI